MEDPKRLEQLDVREHVLCCEGRYRKRLNTKTAPIGDDSRRRIIVVFRREIEYLECRNGRKDAKYAGNATIAPISDAMKTVQDEFVDIQLARPCEIGQAL